MLESRKCAQQLQLLFEVGIPRIAIEREKERERKNVHKGLIVNIHHKKANGGRVRMSIGNSAYNSIPIMVLVHKYQMRHSKEKKKTSKRQKNSQLIIFKAKCERSMLFAVIIMMVVLLLLMVNCCCLLSVHRITKKRKNNLEIKKSISLFPLRPYII